MVEYYTEFWTNAFNFQGRARRAAYWYVWLMNIIITTAILILAAVVPLAAFLGGLYGLAALIPQISLSVRRLHDTGRSGFWLLAGFLPAGIIRLLTSFGGYPVMLFLANHSVLAALAMLIPAAVLVVFLCQDSEFKNYYGPSPKYDYEPEPKPESSFYAKPQGGPAAETGFYKKSPEEPKPERVFHDEEKVEPAPKRSFYNRDKIEPKKEEKSGFYK